MHQMVEHVKLFEDLTGIFDQLNISENTKFISGGDFDLTFDINLDAVWSLQSFI